MSEVFSYEGKGDKGENNLMTPAEFSQFMQN